MKLCFWGKGKVLAVFEELGKPILWGMGWVNRRLGSIGGHPMINFTHDNYDNLSSSIFFIYNDSIYHQSTYHLSFIYQLSIYLSINVISVIYPSSIYHLTIIYLFIYLSSFSNCSIIIIIKSYIVYN